MLAVVDAVSKRSLRILFVAPYVPSLVRVRPYNLIKGLAARGHRITLCVPVTNEGERTGLTDVGQHCEGTEAVSLTPLRPLWNCARAVVRGLPLQALFHDAPELRWRIDRLLSRGNGADGFDVIHVEHLRAALFAWGHVEVPHVFDAVDCISQLFAQTTAMSWAPASRLVARLELERTRRFERRLAAHFDRIVTTSPSERQALLDLSAEEPSEPSGRAHRTAKRAAAQITVITNGVDLEYFRPPAQPRAAATLVYVGRMSYHANVTAVLYMAREVLPRLWAVRPDVRLIVVGERPHRRIRRLAQRDPSRIIVTGAVPDIRPYLAEATVSIAPVLYGVGIQNKVLEALAMGTPVVCSPASAAALRARDGEHLLVAHSAAELAVAVLRLLDEPSLQERLSGAGRAYVEEQHDWRRSAEQLEGIYYEEIERRKVRD